MRGWLILHSHFPVSLSCSAIDPTFCNICVAAAPLQQHLQNGNGKHFLVCFTQSIRLILPLPGCCPLPHLCTPKELGEPLPQRGGPPGCVIDRTSSILLKFKEAINYTGISILSLLEIWLTCVLITYFGFSLYLCISNACSWITFKSVFQNTEAQKLSFYSPFSRLEIIG